MNGGGQKALCALRVTDLPPPPPNHSRRAGAKVPGAGVGSSTHGCPECGVWPVSPRARGLFLCRGPAHLAPPQLSGSRARGSGSRRGWHTHSPGAPPPRAEEPGMSRQLQRGGGLPTSCPAHPRLRPSWTSSILTGKWSKSVRLSGTLVQELPVRLDRSVSAL